MLRERLYPLFAPTGVHIRRLQGVLRDERTEIIATYAGSGANLEFLRRLFFAESEDQILVEHLDITTLNKQLRRHQQGSQLLLVERPPLWATVQPALGELRVPAWIRQEIRLPSTTGRWLLSRHLEREVARQIRRHGYEMTWTRNRLAQEQFYNELYLPYVKRRFGPTAVTVTVERFLRIAGTQILAQLMAGGEWVAGMLLRVASDELRFGWFGAKLDTRWRGASEVLDTLCIHRAASDGIKRIVLGNSRPSLKDGVVRYKAKFGAELRPTRFPQVVLEIGVLETLQPVVNCINAAQLINFDSGEPMRLELKLSGDSVRILRTPLQTSGEIDSAS